MGKGGKGCREWRWGKEREREAEDVEIALFP